MKDKIRPIYFELKGYLSQAPTTGSIFDAAIWNQHNQTIDELEKVTGKTYGKYKVEYKNISWNGAPRQVMESQQYRTKLAGIISRLHGEYFADESSPLEEMPNTVITTNQTQYQNQEQQQSVIVDMAMLIAEKKQDYEEGTPERNFLDQLGEALKKANSVKEIIGYIVNLASATGVGITFLKQIFGW